MNRVEQIDLEKMIGRYAALARSMAGIFINDGSELAERRMMRLCRHVVEPLGVIVLFTRDAGHHTCGWWKNPEYERCYHLSLSFFEPGSGIRLPRNKPQTRTWIEAFFGVNKRWLWCEPPFSPEGQAADVWHYRLFADQAWQPILPRGEVYARALTERGWKSWSDVQADLAAESIRVQEVQG